MARILIVDDEPDILASFADAIQESYPEVEITTLGSPCDALTRARREAFDLVFSDYVMPEMDGIWLLSEIHRLHPETRTVLVSAYYTTDLARHAAEIGQIDRVLAKPTDVDVLTEVVRQLLPERLLRTG